MKKNILFLIMLIISTNSIFCSEQNSLLPRNRRGLSTSLRPVLPNSCVHFSYPRNYLLPSKNLSLPTSNNSLIEYFNQILKLKNFNLWKTFNFFHLDYPGSEEVRFPEILSVEISNMVHEEGQCNQIASFKMHDMSDKESKQSIIIPTLSNVSAIKCFFNYSNRYYQLKRANDYMLKKYFLFSRVVSIPRNPVPLIDPCSEEQNIRETGELILFDSAEMTPSLFQNCQRSFISKEIKSLQYCEGGGEKEWQQKSVTLAKELESLTKNLENLKGELKKTYDEKVVLQDKSREELLKNEENNKLVTELKNKIVLLEKELTNLNTESKETEKKKDLENEEYKKEKESLNNQLLELTNQLKQLEDNKVELENKLKISAEEKEATINNLEKEKIELQTQIASLEKQLQEEKSNLENELTSLKEDFADLQNKKDLQSEEYKKNQEELQDKLLKLNNELATVNEEFKELQTNKVELEKKLKISAGETEDIKNNLEKEKIELQTQIASLEKQLQEEKSNLENELTSLKEALEDLQNKKNLQDKEDKKNQLNLEDKLVKLKNELEAVEKEFKELEKNKLELEEKLKEKENLDEDVKEIDNLKLNINNQKNDIKKNISLFRKIIGFRSDDYKKKKEELKKLETNYQEKKENLLKKFLSERDIQEMEEKKRIIEEAGVFCKIKSFFNPQNNYNKSKEHLENMYHKIVSNHLTIYQAIPDEYQTFLIVDKDRNFVFQIKDIFMSKSLLTKIMFLSAPVISCGFCGWLAFSKSTFSSAINSFSGVINSCIERYNLKEKYPDILKYFGFLFATKKCGDLVLRVVSSENPCVFYVSQQCANNINRGTRFCEKCVKNQQLACMRENYLKANHLV